MRFFEAPQPPAKFACRAPPPNPPAEPAPFSHFLTHATGNPPLPRSPRRSPALRGTSCGNGFAETCTCKAFSSPRPDAAGSKKGVRSFSQDPACASLEPTGKGPGHIEDLGLDGTENGHVQPFSKANQQTLHRTWSRCGSDDPPEYSPNGHSHRCQSYDSQ